MAEEFLLWGKAEKEKCEKYLAWAKAEKNLKVTEIEVPSGIFPPFCLNPCLYDVKVFPSGKRVSDDELYQSNAEYRAKVARGNTLLSMTVQDPASGEQIAILCFLIFAIKKFTGGMGDDDDDDDYKKDLWKNFFTAPPESATRVVSTVKENGAAAHLAAFTLFNERYHVIGSKNVHLIAKVASDIDKYPDNRFRVAKIVGKSIFSLLQELGTEKDLSLINFLSETHLTACFELIDPEDQHVELITLEKPELRFIALTSFEEKDRTICRNPLEGFHKMKSFGLKVVDHEVVELDPTSLENWNNELEAHCKKIRKLHGTEGRVLYFLDKDDTVIGLIKKKSTWYIVLRAIREKIGSYTFQSKSKGEGSNRAALTLESVRDNIKKRLEKRLTEVQTWLNFNGETLLRWTEIGTSFNDWVYQKLSEGTKTIDDTAGNFPVLWNEFLQETGRSDEIDFVE